MPQPKCRGSERRWVSHNKQINHGDEPFARCLQAPHSQENALQAPRSPLLGEMGALALARAPAAQIYSLEGSRP